MPASDPPNRSRGRGRLPAYPCLGCWLADAWQVPLQKILESMEGLVTRGIAVIILTDITLAFGDSSGGARRPVQIIFALSIALAASAFFLSFFPFDGGALV